MFTGRANLILSYVIKIHVPSSLVRLGGLGPSADTTVKRKKQVVRLLTPQQSERYLVKFLLKKCPNKQFHYLQKNCENADLQPKNEYN